MLSQTREIPVISSIAPLAAGTDAWLVDIWGVIHNGVVPFVSATEACRAFRQRGGTVLLLSNAPRPWTSVAGALEKIGVDREAWDAIVTSGDAARGLIAEWAGRPVHHLGPERDLPLLEGLDLKLVAPEAATGIVCTGLFDDTTETPDDYRALLARLHARGLPMICANPDLKVERGGQIIYCAGAIAEAYGAIGGDVVYAGKPHLPIYDAALARIAELRGDAVPRERILAIGDGVKTDILGAVRAGIRSVYVASGIHLQGGLDAQALAKLFHEPEGRPVAAMSAVAW